MTVTDETATSSAPSEVHSSLARLGRYESVAQIVAFALTQIIHERVVVPYREHLAEERAQADNLTVSHHVRHQATEAASNLLTSRLAVNSGISLLMHLFVRALERRASSPED